MGRGHTTANRFGHTAVEMRSCTRQHLSKKSKKKAKRKKLVFKNINIKIATWNVVCSLSGDELSKCDRRRWEE